jgi:hypothetical protein
MKDMGGASYVIGIEVHRDRSKGKLYLSQRAYIKKMLERYGMKSSKPSPAPIARGDKLVNANLWKMSLKENKWKHILMLPWLGL